MNIAAVALAAGASRRFGTENKLLADLGGKPLIRRVAEEILRSCAETVVVTGCDRALIEKALEGLPLRTQCELDRGDGVLDRYRGQNAWLKNSGRIHRAPRDMPFLTSDLLRKLIAPFEASQGTSIIYPTTPMGEQRNPALWPRRFFPQLASLSGPQGAKQLLVDCKSSQEHMLRRGRSPRRSRAGVVIANFPIYDPLANASAKQFGGLTVTCRSAPRSARLLLEET